MRQNAGVNVKPSDADLGDCLSRSHPETIDSVHETDDTTWWGELEPHGS